MSQNGAAYLTARRSDPLEALMGSGYRGPICVWVRGVGNDLCMRMRA